MAGAGIHGIGPLPLIRRGVGQFGMFVYPFSLDDITFTPNMRVGAGAKAFDASPIFQGKWDGTGTPDVVSFPRGTLLGNQTQFFYSNFDPYQGSVSFWINPEWAGNDGIEHNIAYASANYRVYKSTGNALVAVIGGQTFTGPSTAAWVAGTAYYIVFSYDTKNTFDGTNYARWSFNDAQTYSVTTQPTATAPDAAIYVGSKPTLAADANIEGFVCSRVPFYDGAYGVPMWFDETGPIDVIAAIYAAGAGADPAQIFGSWDVTFFLPTDQTEGPLQTTGQAWSHPHGSELIDVPFLDDGGLPGTDRCVAFDGAATWINCNSGATLDDLGAAGATFQLEIWFRLDDASASTHTLVHKGSGLATGWVIYTGATGILTGYVPLAGTNAQAEAGAAVWDGKYHHALLSYNDTTKSLQMALDGVWGAADVGAGAYQSDAASDWEFGRLTNLSSYHDGAIAWSRVWNAATYTPGTDFVADRVFASGGTVEAWAMDEGTGATIAASITSPANDGTITSGSWSAIWAIVGTPEIPQSLEFFQENDGIDFGSGVNIDDLFTADCTIECWARLPRLSSAATYFLTKNGGGTADGWRLSSGVTGDVRFNAFFGGTNISIDTGDVLADLQWHHIAVDFDVGTLTARCFVDGQLLQTSVAVGAYLVDAARDLICNGVISVGTVDDYLAIGPIRLSDSRRYTGNSFIPPSRVNWPANDANAHLVTRMNDGAGTTVTDYSGNGYNGTVTFGASTRWNNTPDLLIDEPGAMIYQQGYNIGSDGADDGMGIPHTLAADTDYVIRVPVRPSPRAWIRITLWDTVGAAAIVDFDAPPLTGVHSGAINLATLVVAGEVFPASLIGSALYNVTDGSSTIITAVGGTNQDTITGVLAGGTDDDWDTNDVFYIVPYSGWVFNEPIAVTTSANTAYELRITNRNSDGVIAIHLAEVLLSLINTGSMETGAGNPWIPTSWNNTSYVAGETVQELSTVHSGASALEIVTPAATRNMFSAGLAAIADGDYCMWGSWFNETAPNITILEGNLRVVAHNTLAGTQALAAPTSSTWIGVCRTGRRDNALVPNCFIQGATAAAGFVDDVYIFRLDSITLTVTPASAANSLEGTGIRIDGRDSATVPAAAHRMRARSGGLKWRATPRHDLALAQGFGQASEYLLDLTEDANNYLRLVRTTNLITLAVNQNGAGEVTDADATAWAVDTEVLWQVKNLGSRIRVWRDGVVVLALAGLAGFAADFTQPAYFASEDTPSLEFDGVISPP